jgi:3(or 17)beta-hydroxysteroid dehydrogenase
MPRICWQTIFICGNHRGNGKPLKQLKLLSRQADIRRVTGASGVNLRSPAGNQRCRWSAAVAAALARFGKLDILVNNAGLFLGKDIEAASLAEWERLCAVNLTGVFLGTKLCLPALREAAQQSPQGSAIVNLASTAGLVGSTQDPLYSMTKGGVTLFTKSAALEFARKGYRIRVNSMHPGTIDTDMGDQVLVTRARNLGTNDIEAARRQVIERLPIGRVGSPDDIAKGIVFLASDDAAFMTGAGLVIDGGRAGRSARHAASMAPPGSAAG